MSFTIDGTAVKSITVGGVPCKDILIGKDAKYHAWCVPPEGLTYNVIQYGTAGSGYSYELVCTFKNNSTQKVKYAITHLRYGSDETEVAGGDIGAITLQCGRVMPMTSKPQLLQAKYLNNTVNISCTYNQTIIRG